MKLTVQTKLLPAPAQAEALTRTIEAVNAGCNRLSQLAWENQEFRQIPLQRLFYRQLRDETALSAQVVTQLIAKVANSYKLGKSKQRIFRKYGSIAFDSRILSWNMAKSIASIWTLAGRQAIPFICGKIQRDLLPFQRGESDLVIRDGMWFLLTTIDIPDKDEIKALDYIGVDLGIVQIASTSDGIAFAGAHLNGLRARHRRIRKRLQTKGTRAARHLLARRRLKERRFSTHVNHTISKKIVSLAERTGRGIALEDLKHIRARIRAGKRERTVLHSWAFGQLQAFVNYKAKRAGVPVVFVDPRNTSRKCTECGHIAKANRKSQAEFACVVCGHAANADTNAAKNIRWAACKPAALDDLLAA